MIASDSKINGRSEITDSIPSNQYEDDWYLTGGLVDSCPPPVKMESSDPFDDDWTLARALQVLEFEILNENAEVDGSSDPDGDFTIKEYDASGCKNQMLTISTFICIVQIGLLVAEIQIGGYAPKTENPLIGPPATTMVLFGAKVASLIVYKNQWWRLVSGIMLHAGIVHIITNVAVQLRVGGYLVRIFGTPRWLWIYFCSGVFGNIMSCIFLPNSVAVGSSGAVLGMLTAWVVWIIFRWRKIPKRYHSQRNCQLVMIVVSVIVTLGMSFAPFVDWAAHFGGAIQGAIWGAILLSHELESFTTRWCVRLIGFALFVLTYAYALYYVAVALKPSRQFLVYFEQNDDFHHQQQSHHLRHR